MNEYSPHPKDKIVGIKINILKVLKIIKSLLKKRKKK